MEAELCGQGVGRGREGRGGGARAGLMRPSLCLGVEDVGSGMIVGTMYGLRCEFVDSGPFYEAITKYDARRVGCARYLRVTGFIVCLPFAIVKERALLMMHNETRAATSRALSVRASHVIADYSAPFHFGLGVAALLFTARA